MLASPDFKGGKKRAENRRQLNAAIEAALVKKTSAEWIEILNRATASVRADLQGGRSVRRPQVSTSAWRRRSSMQLGRKNVLANAAVLSRTPAKVVSPTPEIGEHTDEDPARAEVHGAQEIEQLRKGGVV